MSSDTFSSWFRSFASCGGSRKKARPGGRFNPSNADRNIVVLRDQPAVIPQPSAAPAWSSEKTYEKTLERERERTRLRRRASRDSSARPNWFAGPPSSSVRRLHISGPTDFRHLQSDSFQFPPEQASPPQRSRPRSFRPIELSIYQPHNRLSAILPHIECNLRPPPRAHTTNSSGWDGSNGMPAVHERSQSTMSFHLPRKVARQNSGMSAGMSDPSISPPRIPPKSRARASTTGNTVRIVERIASAILEKERLQDEINSVIQRQSIYISSRPSTGYDNRGFEPMPSIPALPASAPSFAERLTDEHRPRTAPSHMQSMTVQEKTLRLTAAAQSQSPPSNFTSPRSTSSSQVDQLNQPLAPPLPLVLRPPLRKKKSFSRVSNWLFHPEEQDPTIAGNSQSPTMTFSTTSPRPLKESDGFYQCVAPPEGLPRTSMETSSSVYTWETGDGDSAESGDEGAKTVPTTTAAWSPDQTPKQGSSSSRHTTPVIGAGKGFEGGVVRVVLDGGVEGGMAVEKMQTESGQQGLAVPEAYEGGHRPQSVGVAI